MVSLYRAILLCLTLSLGLSTLQAEAELTPPALLGRGVVVEFIPAENVLEKAGVLPGDVFHSWQRLPSPPENPLAESGELASPFDWEWMVIEQAMRGTVRITGAREGRPFTWDLPIGLLFGAGVRPAFPPSMLEPYEHGWELLQKDQVAEAIDCWRFLAEGLRRSGDGRSASWLFLRMARSLAFLRNWKEAEIADEAALAEARDPRAQVTVLYFMGRFYENAGRFAEAEACNQAELRIAVSTWGTCLEQALAELRLGLVDRNQGLSESAREHLEQALALEKRQAPKSGLIAETLRALGGVLLDRGELETAERYVRTAFEMEQATAPASGYVTAALTDLALIKVARGDMDWAEDIFRQAVERERESHAESSNLAVALENLAGIAQERDDSARAKDLYQQALGMGEKVYPESMRYARALEGRGRLAATERDPEGAEVDFRRAERILNRVAPASLVLAMVLTDLGVLSARRGNLGRAESQLLSSLALSQRVAPESSQRAETFHRLAWVLRKKGKPAQAARELSHALEILEAQVGQLGGSTEAKGAFRAQGAGIYRDAVRQEVELGHPWKAFRLLERFRAQAFLALLAERDLAFSADIPAALDRERRRVTALYDGNELRLAALDPDHDKKTVESLRHEQRSLREKREEVVAEIHRASPRLAAMIHPQKLTFEAVRAALDPGTVMLSYNVGEEETQLFIVTPGKDLAVKTLPIGEEALRKEVTHLRQLVDQVQSRAGLGAVGLDWTSRHLYQLLVEPAEPWIAAGERILIVPDGPLHVLPFAALIRRSGPIKKAGRSGQYLIEWKPLHTVLSGTVFAEIKERRKEASATHPLEWIAFGDPWFPPLLALSRPQETKEARLRSFSTRNGLHWERLPESRREVEQIADLYPREHRRVYVDREATEERVKALDRNAKIVHFATHGYVDDRSPFDSGLVLAIPEQFAEGHDNGLLQVWEIFESVRLDADLVVLSACETGLGEIRGGEGVIGLTRAFQYAGARSVLASLWSVDDRATAELMERFYHHLRAGKAKAEALRAAQLDLLGEKVHPGRNVAAPYFWASMQLFGDWQ